jgi:hypothetical protein
VVALKLKNPYVSLKRLLNTINNKNFSIFFSLSYLILIREIIKALVEAVFVFVGRNIREALNQ